MMRTARVFYLFLSVLQFIFFLKLVEYVRGEEIKTASNNKQASFIASRPVGDKDEEGRGMFIAPNIIRKKSRAQVEKSTNASEANSRNVTTSQDGVVNNTQNRRQQYEKEIARLCPACENNQCIPPDPINAGFPIVPVIIAVVTGIIWFALFLAAWIFAARPNTKGQSGGYDEGGYGSPQPEYGANTDSGKPSIFDHFMKPHERSLQSYTQLLHNVLDSIEKFSDLYNSF